MMSNCCTFQWHINLQYACQKFRSLIAFQLPGAGSPCSLDVHPRAAGVAAMSGRAVVIATAVSACFVESEH